MSLITVFTGDLVASTSMRPSDVDRAMAALQDMALAQDQWTQGAGRFSRHRGDGWQVVLHRPALALRAALCFAAVLRAQGISTYMALATGPHEGPLPADLNDATGAVFAASGRLLDDMKSGTSRRMAMTPTGPRAATLALADHISQGWTAAQATTLLPMLAPNDTPSFTALAKTLGKSRQAATKALDGAGYDALRRALTHFEAPEPAHD